MSLEETNVPSVYWLELFYEEGRLEFLKKIAEPADNIKKEILEAESEVKTLKNKIKELGEKDKRFLVFSVGFYERADAFPAEAHFDTLREATEYIPSKPWRDCYYLIYDRIEGVMVNTLNLKN